jgi:CheY-like chemotaxis protein
MLIVDAEPAILQLLGEVLADRGFAVCPAASASEALELYWQHRPAIALADLDLAGAEGQELLADLRRVHPGIRLRESAEAYIASQKQEG